MSTRIADLNVDGAYAAGSSTGVQDLTQGGMQGYASDIAEWLSNQAYVSRPLVAVVLRYPRIFDFLPNPEKWRAAYKAIIEIHSRTISGFDASLSVDFEEHSVGGAGVMQSEPINVTRAQPTPSHGVTEKRGRPVQRMLDIIIRYGMMDPDTKYPLASILNESGLQDFTADLYTGVHMYFEPDPLWRGINHAWLCAGMAVKGTGPIEAQKDLTSSQSIRNLDLEFTCMAQVGAGVDLYATELMRSMRTLHADPHMRRAAYQDIDPDLVASGDSDYKGTFVKTGVQAVAKVGRN